MAIKLKLLIVLTLLVGWQYAADAQLISFSPTEINAGNVRVGSTFNQDLRFTYSGPDSGAVLVVVEGFYPNSDLRCNQEESAAPQAFLDTIQLAMSQYYADHPPDSANDEPLTIFDLTGMGYLTIPDQLGREWDFGIFTICPSVWIEGRSTAEMEYGTGFYVMLDLPYGEGLHYGWGYHYAGWRMANGSEYILPISFTPYPADEDIEYADTLTVNVLLGENQLIESYRIAFRGTGTVSVDDDAPPQPGTFLFLNPYPNPFNSSTTITFSQSISSLSRLSVFDETGKEVALLREGWSPAGMQRVSWNATGLPSGVYYPTLMMNGQSKSVRAVFVK